MARFDSGGFTDGDSVRQCWDIVALAQDVCGEAVVDTTSRLAGILSLGGLCVGDCSVCPVGIVRTGGRAAKKVVLDTAGEAVLGGTDFLMAITRMS